ncbi:MAG: squalene/phytoene synthase family protein [Steroidobacteraceae bacterium]
MTDDPLKRGTPPGSLRHFAVMYAPARGRAVIEALYAYEAEIDETVQTSNHEVAHTRLHWWRTEIDRLRNGQPQHPITRALLPLRAIAGDELQLLHEPLVAADIDLARMVLQNPQELEAYCLRSSGSLQTLAAIASSEPRPVSTRERVFARGLGSCIRRTEILRDLRRDLGHGRLRLPLEVLEAAGIDPGSLRAETWNAPLSRMLDDVREALRREIDALPAELDRDERRTQRQGLVLAALHQRLLANIAHRTELARTRAEVSPWSKLWTAWRAAMRAA